MAQAASKVEDKLYLNRYLVDAGRAHIKVRPHPKPSPQLVSLLKLCPAHCYEMNSTDRWTSQRMVASSVAPAA